jgi:DNA-binding transcriptional LysR family regulator
MLMVLVDDLQALAPLRDAIGAAPVNARVHEIRPATASWIAEMHLFVAVAQAGSFTRAADQLGIPYSTMSRRISRLERSLGVRLLSRTTHRVDLTEEGKEYFLRAERIVADAVALQEDLSYRLGRPSGLLRVSLPECIAVQVATPWIAEFSALHPDVAMQIDTAPEHVDPDRDRFDVCITHTSVTREANVKRTIVLLKRTLFASPSYVEKHGLPLRPEDLAHHQCICMADDRSSATVWSLHRDTEEVRVEVSGMVTTYSQMLAPELARQGLGIAPGMLGPLQDDVTAGRLIPVLTDWQLEPMALSVVLPERVVPARARVFVEFFVSKYRELAREHAWTV